MWAAPENMAVLRSHTTMNIRTWQADRLKITASECLMGNYLSWTQRTCLSQKMWLPATESKRTCEIPLRALQASNFALPTKSSALGLLLDTSPTEAWTSLKCKNNIDALKLQLARSCHFNVGECCSQSVERTIPESYLITRSPFLVYHK